MTHSSPRGGGGGYLILKEKQSAFRTLELDVIQRPTLDEVKASYRRLALKYHPDKLAQALPEAEKQVSSPTGTGASSGSGPNPQQKFLEIQRAYEVVCKDAENNPHLYARRESVPSSPSAGVRSPGVPAFVPSSSSPMSRPDSSQFVEKGLHTPLGQRARTPTFGSASAGGSSGRNESWARTPSGFSSSASAASPPPTTKTNGSTFAAAPSYSEFAEAAETLNEPVNSRVAASLQRIEAQWNQRAADIRAEAKVQWERRMKLNEKSSRRSTVPSRPTNMSPGPTEASQTAAKRASESPLRPSTPRPAPNSPSAVAPSVHSATEPAAASGAQTVSPRRTNSPKRPTLFRRGPASGSTTRTSGDGASHSPSSRQVPPSAASAAATTENPHSGTQYDLPEDDTQQDSFEVKPQSKVGATDKFSEFIDRLISLTRAECERRFQLVTLERCQRSMLNIERREMEVRAVIRAQDGHFWDRLLYAKVVEIPLTLRRPHLEPERTVASPPLGPARESPADDMAGKEDSSPSLRPHLSSWRQGPAQPSLVPLAKSTTAVTSSPYRSSTSSGVSPIPAPSIQRRHSCSLSPIAPHLGTPQLQRRAYHIL